MRSLKTPGFGHAGILAGGPRPLDLITFIPWPNAAPGTFSLRPTYSDHERSNDRQSSYRASRQTTTQANLVITLALLLVIGFAAALFWSERDLFNDEPRSDPVQATSEPPPPVAQIGTPSDTIQALDALKQSVKDLEASRQQLAHQLDEVKSQLASEQGERKMLTEQVGALSGRMDGLTGRVDGLTSEISLGNTGTAPSPSAQKKKSRSR